MAGHSKWANIQHRKGKQDKLRSKSSYPNSRTTSTFPSMRRTTIDGLRKPLNHVVLTIV